MNEPFFLGLDSSTQALKATLIDENLAVCREASIPFDDALPEFRTGGGAHRHPDALTVTAPPLMWVAALDMLLEHMTKQRWPLAQIAAISGSGQQHGSVWLRNGIAARLASLNPSRSLREQLADAFSIPESPIWMDSSTGPQCAALEQALGGPQAVADLTGSRAYERFTGNQIAKLCQTHPEAYAQTERISLVSSFIASLLLGRLAPADFSDAAGMNLMDFRARTWAPRALDATAPALAPKLCPLAPSHAIAGPISPYHVQRYGFSPLCQIITFSGDNPNSLAGLRLNHPGDVAISLGTSDTLFASLTEPRPSGSEGHVFPNPVDPDAYMAMICRKNGSLTRKAVRDAIAAGAWDTFNALVSSRSPGNDGMIGFYVLSPEITPPLRQTGYFRFDAADRPCPPFDPPTEARALLEGQFLSLRLHAERIGIAARTVLATGGASANPAILQIIADIFGTPVLVAGQSDSASLGAAYRALHGWACRDRFIPFSEIMGKAAPFRNAANPSPSAKRAYDILLPRVARLEQALLSASADSPSRPI